MPSKVSANAQQRLGKAQEMLSKYLVDAQQMLRKPSKKLFKHLTFLDINGHFQKGVMYQVTYDFRKLFDNHFSISSWKGLCD